MFLLPICLIGLLFEVLLRSIPNTYSYKAKWLEAYATDIRIISLGSSHGYYGIDPKYFDEPAFNAAHVSQSLKYDDFIFSQYIDKASLLEWVILPVSYGSLLLQLENSGEDYRVRNYCIYYENCPYHRHSIKYRFEIFGGNLSNKLPNIWYHYVSGKSYISCDSLGRGTDYLLANRYEYWENSGMTAAKRHTKDIDTDIINNNKAYVEHIINKCVKRNISVLLLTTPAYITYRSNLDEKQLLMTESYCDSLVSHYDNVIYLNLLDDERFNEHDFYDSDHLNEYGAEKLTKILSGTIYDITK